MTGPLLPPVLFACALLIVGYGVVAGRSFGARLMRAVAGPSRQQVIRRWALGLVVSYALPSLFALAMLGRLDAAARMPDELRQLAYTLGWPGEIDAGDLGFLGLALGLGATIGLAMLAVRRRLGKRPIGLRYRSVAAARDSRDWASAAALAAAAGVSEELFFRLVLPLLGAIVIGSPAAGFAIALVAFVALHRHQGRGGMVAVALVGLALSALYVFTGLLWVVILVHVLINLNALIVRPAVSGPAAPVA